MSREASNPIKNKLIELDQRMANMEGELAKIKESLSNIPHTLEEERKELSIHREEFNKLQGNFQEISRSVTGFNQKTINLERRMEVTKKNLSSGTVASILIFTILFILSLFVRA
ncbi:MAG: hypothetical protein HQL52_15430 [Magnetococcales bacterium]|nr:hypothetical protein [Magnetococcales bacterium]